MKASAARVAFFALVLICVLIRVVVHFNYMPVQYPDSSGYINLASQIRSLDFGNYDGSRTPIYPLMLLSFGLDYGLVWYAQMAMGISISLMLYWFALNRTQSAIFAFLVGLSHSLSLNQLFAEANILSETLSTFLLVCSLLLVAPASHRTRHYLPHLACTGIVVGLAGLTRPILLLLAPLYCLFFALQWSHQGRAIVPTTARASHLLSFASPIIVMVLGWSVFNSVTTNYFGPTTLVGYNLSQHAGAFIELAPDEYAEIRDLYLRYRQAQIANTGSHSMTIWNAYPEMQKVTGTSFGDLSRRLTTLSVTLFVEHPTLYLKSASRAWIEFWRVSNYWQLEQVKLPFLARALESTWWIEKRLLVLVNLMFLSITAYSLCRSLIRRQLFPSALDVLVIAVVLSASVVQALTEYGENARYSIPIQSLVVYLVSLSAWSYIVKSRQLRRGSASH